MAAVVFDFLVVGSGGGPDETNLSAYLFKPLDARWEDGIIALEAGSGQGALRQLLRQNPQLFDPASATDAEEKKRAYTASDIYSFVRSYLVTHAHLDHINSLVISAGSLHGPRKNIYATKQVLHDLEMIFSDRLWPNLASWKEVDDDFKLLYKVLDSDAKYHTIYPSISVRSFPLSHGTNEQGHYESSAFFIRHDPSSTEFLFFGDVEPDSVASTPLTLNVWTAAAPKIPDTLNTIFIECSWPSGRKDDMLYGHLTPEHLVDELTALAKEVIIYRKDQTLRSAISKRNKPARPRKRRKKNPVTLEELTDALKGVRVYVIHCKDDMTGGEDKPARQLITQQVRDLVQARNLGAVVECAEPGARISI